MGLLLGGLASMALASSAGGSDAPEALLDLARDGNRAAIESIRTMECRYERQPWDGTTESQAKKYVFLPSGRFWRSGGDYRIIEPVVDGTTKDMVVRNGQGLCLRSGGPLAAPILSRETLRPVDGVGGDMWQYLLFSHCGWNPPSFYPLTDILDHPYTLNRAERAVGGEIYVDLRHAGVKRQEFWFDPKVNYLVRKSVLTPAADADLRWEHDVIAFSEAAPGVFVPTTVETRLFIKGNRVAVVRTTLTDLKVNHDLPAAALRVPGVAGRSCLDLDRDSRYEVDADGNRVGPETLVKVTRIAPPATDGSGDGPPARPVPSREPTPWWVWVLSASGVVLAAGLGLAAIRRLRRGRGSGVGTSERVGA
jgi:hypothetical protein